MKKYNEKGQRLYRHHIIPTHMGGPDEESNIEWVTAKEHLQRHKDLYEEYELKEDQKAINLWTWVTNNEEQYLSRTPETRKKISISNKGKKLSDETKAKIGAASKGRNPYANRSAEENAALFAQISATLKGRKMPGEIKAKIRATMTGRKHSAETKSKMSATWKNKSDEERAEFGAKTTARQIGTKCYYNVKTDHFVRITPDKFDEYEAKGYENRMRPRKAKI